MTIRDDTRTRIKAIMLDAIGPAKVFDMAEVDAKVEGWLDDFMATDPLRLAEWAEQMNERLAGNYEVKIVDVSRVVSFETDALEGVMRGVWYTPVIEVPQ
jgi:hypothetical protein